MSTPIDFADFKVVFNVLTAWSKLGGPSLPHRLLSPVQSPLHPGAISLPSKLRTN